MIPVTKNFLNKPARLVYTHAQLQLALADLLVNGNSHRFKSSIYRNGSIDDLKIIYKDKCGYCESNTSAGAELRVDHYRPKDKITGVPGHPGYYWLSYEWSNLVLACEKCNISKSNKFPLASPHNRISAAPMLAGNVNFNIDHFPVNHHSHQNEQPLIVNPEVDSGLTSWFVFLPSGRIVGLNDQARETIDVCKLNRQPLLIERKKLVETYQRKIRKVLSDYHRNGDSNALKIRLRDIFDELKGLSNKRRPYSRLGYFMFAKFDIFIASFMAPKSQALLLQLFNNYKSGQI